MGVSALYINLDAAAVSLRRDFLPFTPTWSKQVFNRWVERLQRRSRKRGKWDLLRFSVTRRGSWLAYSSYQLTCGRGDTWGDGITPIEAAHLAGAENLVVEGVRHSPRSPGIWYGSPEILPAWVSYLA
ncbi:hypothetical protein MiSe_16300 [Microseira wollei NIES-4236]|uniref:Uncharacterized protein n=1 Tax=Microseira wollei NIES-4236 TaxID=2530354 RepID=A0AAV3X3Q1_9CYAN|nr:hypothetical protein MiSe_16300 [Microseira wollei NIES-4236]